MFTIKYKFIINNIVHKAYIYIQLSVFCEKKNKKKKRWPTDQTRPAPLQPAGYVSNFLQVENINPHRQKMQIMRVDPADSTHFAISSLVWDKNWSKNFIKMVGILTF